MKKFLATYVIFLSLILSACGAEEENKGELVVTDPGEVDIVRLDFDVFGNLVLPKVIFNSALPVANLSYYGWFAVLEISEVDFPEKCSISSYRALTVSIIDLPRFPIGKYYTRACAGNVNGTFSKGVTKEFVVKEN